jgi:integrase
MDLWRDVPQTPLWRLLMEVGIRWGDALALTPANVVGDALFISAPCTKGRADRTIPLPPGLGALLRLPFRTPAGMPWTKRNEKNARRMMRAALRRAKIPLVDPSGRRIYVHALRATAASTMFRRGARLPTVARMLGHRDPAFTAKHYLPPDFDALQDEMGRVWGKG